MSFQGRNNLMFIAAAWLLAVVLALPGALMGQQVYGSIYGSVVDKSGAGVPNASISITELTKNVQAKTETNESGNYRLGQLIPGTYRVEVEAKGFRKSVTDTEVRVDQAARADFALDSVTETKIAAQNYDAEFGMASAGIVLTSTKSGSNDLHGSAFEYLRDNTPGFQSFARNPFNSAENAQVPPVKWNQFGGTIGGAVIKNKLFYFGDAQLTRRRTGSSVLTAVPTVRARSGILANIFIPIRAAPFTTRFTTRRPATLTAPDACRLPTTSSRKTA